MGLRSGVFIASASFDLFEYFEKERCSKLCFRRCLGEHGPRGVHILYRHKMR